MLVPAAATAVVLSSAGLAYASSVDIAVVDVTTPVSSVTVEAGAPSTPITINATITGNQVGTATFEVYRDWTLSGGEFTGSNPQEYTVGPRAGGAPADTFSTQGTVTVDAGQPAGTFTLAVSAFDITNSNPTGGKLAVGEASSYVVTVTAPAPSANEAPVVSIDAKPGATVEGNTRGGADVAWGPVTVTDEESLTATCTDSDGAVVRSGTTFFALGSHTVTCTATDSSGQTGSDSFGFSVVDTTPPVVTVPEDFMAKATSNSQAAVSYPTASATDIVDGNLTATCEPASGSSFPVGETTVTCTATDSSLNVGTGTFTVTVTYDFRGLFRPVDMAGLNSVKAGSAVPIKFSLSGNQGLAVFETGYPRSRNVASSIDDPTPTALSTLTAGQSSLSYDASSDTYTYVWKTDKAWAGTTRELVIVLADGTTVPGVQFLMK